METASVDRIEVYPSPMLPLYCYHNPALSGQCLVDSVHWTPPHGDTASPMPQFKAGQAQFQVNLHTSACKHIMHWLTSMGPAIQQLQIQQGQYGTFFQAHYFLQLKAVIKRSCWCYFPEIVIQPGEGDGVVCCYNWVDQLEYFLTTVLSSQQLKGLCHQFRAG